jgi:hypothetical protein
MDFSTNIKYFGKSKNLFLYIGLGIAALGIVLLIVGWYFMYCFGVMLAGGAVCIIARGSKLKDDDIDVQTEKKYQDFMSHIAVDKLDIIGKEVKLFQPVEVGAYAYEGLEGILAKKGSDGKLRSSYFSRTGIFFAVDMMYIYKASFSLIEEKESSEMLKVKYGDVSKAELTNETFTSADGTLKVPYTMFRITTLAGKEFNFPMRNDAESDKLAENINYQAKKAQQ